MNMTVVLRFRRWSWNRFHLWLRIRCWFHLWFWCRSWLWFYFWFWSWFRCWLNLRFWSRFYLWFRCWFIFTIYVFTLTIFICLPCNIAFFSIPFSQHLKTCRFSTIRSNTYCTLKVSFTIYIVMIVNLVSQII